MKTLVLNCGSSTIKYKLFQMAEGRQEELVEGILERMGHPPSKHRQIWNNGETYQGEVEVRDHRQGVEVVLEALRVHSPQSELVDEIEAVGHRVVHGGAEVTGSVLVDESVLESLRRHSHLAPLHNPPSIAGIEACRSALPKARQAAVFDNALHHTLPPHVYSYGLPFEMAERQGVRRYGFHGIAFRSALERAGEVLGGKLEDRKVITLMLGSGCTANACVNGRSVEVSTGFTPLEGLVQSTRSGDVDAAAVLHLMEREGLGPGEMGEVLNRQSGLLGISGVSGDMRDIEREAARGNERARLAIEVFVHRARKYLGGYAAAMGGVDVVIFAGGIGLNCPRIRADICRGLEFMGLAFDEKANGGLVGEGVISAESSRVKVLVVEVDEELVIARDTFQLVGSRAEDAPKGDSLPQRR